MEYIRILEPILSFILNIISQIIIFRFVRLGMLKSIFGGFIIGFLNLFIIEFIFFAHSVNINNIGYCISNVIIYLSLGYCYFHFLTLGETARRIRILTEFYFSKEGLSLEELLAEYNSKNIVEMRLQRLLSNKQIINSNGKYYIGNKTVLLMAKIAITMKLIILGKKSEFD